MDKKKSDDNTTDNKFSNFLINASNQANLTGTSDVTAYQINSVFIFIDPYKLESFEMEEVPGLEIDIDEKGYVCINGQEYKLIETTPGISVFGVVKHDKEQ